MSKRVDCRIRFRKKGWVSELFNLIDPVFKQTSYGSRPVPVLVPSLMRIGSRQTSHTGNVKRFLEQLPQNIIGRLSLFRHNVYETVLGHKRYLNLKTHINCKDILQFYWICINFLIRIRIMRNYTDPSDQVYGDLIETFLHYKCFKLNLLRLSLQPKFPSDKTNISKCCNSYLLPPRLSVERMTRIANSMPSFQSLSKVSCIS